MTETFQLHYDSNTLTKRFKVKHVLPNFPFFTDGIIITKSITKLVHGFFVYINENGFKSCLSMKFFSIDVVFKSLFFKTWYRQQSLAKSAKMMKSSNLKNWFCCQMMYIGIETHLHETRPVFVTILLFMMSLVKYKKSREKYFLLKIFFNVS